jgi:hypothetical protein
MNEQLERCDKYIPLHENNADGSNSETPIKPISTGILS